MMHTPPATPAEVRAVLELFPKCTACGAPLDSTDAVPDGNHAFRMRHRGPCPACSPAPLPAA
jgi:hypothetical protein